jgi:hypothetical protein
MKKLSMLAIAATACGALTFTALETSALAGARVAAPNKAAKQQAREAKRGAIGKAGTKVIRFGERLRIKRNPKNNSKRVIAHAPRALAATVWNPVVTWPVKAAGHGLRGADFVVRHVARLFRASTPTKALRKSLAIGIPASTLVAVAVIEPSLLPNLLEPLSNLASAARDVATEGVQWVGRNPEVIPVAIAAGTAGKAVTFKDEEVLDGQQGVND